jgi:hypothetical protein
VQRSCHDADAWPCEELYVYVNVPSTDYPDSAGQTVLGDLSFTYTVSDQFVCCGDNLSTAVGHVWTEAVNPAMNQLGGTTDSHAIVAPILSKYGQSSANWEMDKYSINYATETTSVVAGVVSFAVKNGLSASGGASSVMQESPPTKQAVTVVAADETDPMAAIEIWIVELPTKVRTVRILWTSPTYFADLLAYL